MLPELMPWLLGTSAVFGLLIGSFLNVCIYRLPREQSIVLPRSYCPHCQHQLTWFENIPLVSFLFLRGRCRYCHEPISWRYPTVELLTALISVAVLWRFPLPAHYIAYFLLLSAPLLAIVFIDLEHLLILDVITYPGMVLGVVVHVTLGQGAWTGLLIESLLGLLLGGGSLWLISWFYERTRGRMGLGLGDVKLAAMLGAFFGWQAILFILLMASVAGTLIGGLVLLLSRTKLDHPVPFGPFLALAAWAYLFFGTILLDGYLDLGRQLLRTVS